MKKQKINMIVIISIAVILLTILLLEVSMVFGQVQKQTKELGVSQLESISRELERSIYDAEGLTMQIALEAREHLGDENEIRDFIYEKKQATITKNIGVFNVYIAGSDWWIIPDFDAPSDYVAQDRSWYKGAIRNDGKVFVSSPYQDAMTYNICYTVSIMLGDGETVLAVDYTMDTVQTYVEKISSEGNYRSVIATNDGIIAGSFNDEYIGKHLEDNVPEFTGIWALSKRSEGFVNARIKSDFLYDNLFALKSENGWILIVSINDWQLYKTVYIQLIIMIILFVAFIVSLVFSYIFVKRTKNSDEISLQKAKQEKTVKKQKIRSVNKKYRNYILVFMTFVMMFSLYSIVFVTYRWGNTQMKNEADKYEYHLSKWVDKQKSILDMFVNTIAIKPEMLDDYDATISYLDGITSQFSEISVTYMTSPNLNPTVYMNNGWLPGPDFDITERAWYIGATTSNNGWYVTPPYYDEQTGGYCVTMAEQVFNVKTGEFLGVFGIDFYMDKLVEIMGDSYSNDGYAFLVDTEGNIINHPYGKYQMTVDSQTSVLELPYAKVKTDGQKAKIIKDYDGSIKILLAITNESSRFSVYAITNASIIYGRVIVYGLICFSAFLVCIILIYRLLSGMITWQDEVNKKLEKAAQTDAMTGLLNKKSTEEAISQAIKQKIGVFIIIDLDSFKLINDIYSHKVGDQILIKFAELIRSVIRENDITGRIGGDEFALFCDGLTDEEIIKKKCEYLNNEILLAAKKIVGEELDVPLGCSSGVVFVPKDGNEYSILFSKADMALHQIKKSGKHDVRIYNDDDIIDSPKDNKLSNLQVIFGERNIKKTALVLDRESFTRIYQYMERLSFANDWNLFLIEVTLEAKDPTEQSECVDRFIELSSSILRKYDIIMKYNEKQVIILLMKIEYSDLDIPLDRVMNSWNKNGMNNVDISYHEEQVNKR